MVAISLYRGNMHRVPDVPRRWLMPTPKISLRDFKTLLNRRNKALSRLCPSSSQKPNPNPTLTEEPSKPNTVHFSHEPIQSESKIQKSPLGEVEEDQVKDGNGDNRGGRRLEVWDCSEKPVDVQSEKAAADTVGGGEILQVEKPVGVVNPDPETNNQVDASNEKLKRKREVEEKLEVLTAKKHNLVQVLKQILNIEEALKRPSTVQGVTIRPDGATDSGSMIRHGMAKMGSEANLRTESEGGEAEDTSNHNVPSRHMLRMSSTSPSSESPLRRLTFSQHNVVPHPTRASLGVTVSPSRFAPTGPQAHPGNLPSVSISGTNYVASSPSPAASGGTSVFRDARLPSPWN